MANNETVKQLNNSIKIFYSKLLIINYESIDTLMNNFLNELDGLNLEEEIPNNDDDPLSDLSYLSLDNLVTIIKKQINFIKGDLNLVIDGYINNNEIFLDLSLDYIKENLLVTLIDRENYLGGFYLVGIECLLIIWKNEINLLDESMSFHHREKSKKEIKDIYKTLEEKINNINDESDFDWAEEGIEVFKNIIEYSKFILFKHNFPDIFDTNFSDKYKYYLDLIKFNNLCDTFEKDNEELKNDIKKVLREILGEEKFNGFINNDGNSNLEGLNDLELFLYFRFIKDVKFIDKPKNAYFKLKEILSNNFDNNSVSTLFNENKIKNNKVYFINNLISLLEKIEDDGFEFDEEMEYIKDFFDEKELKRTYFTYFKKASFYKNRLQLGKAKENIEKSIKKFEEFDGTYYPFSSPKKLMILDSVGILSFSTFIKTKKTDYLHKIKNEQIEISEKKAEKRIREREKEIEEKIKKNEKEIEEKIKIIDDKMQDSQIKSIEILGIFSAVILFASGSIQIFQYLSTIQSAVYFIIGFSYSLVVFVLTIFFITKGAIKDIEINKKRGFYFVLIVMFFLFPLIFWWISREYINETPLINEKYKDTIKEEILSDKLLKNQLLEELRKNKVQKNSLNIINSYTKIKNENTRLKIKLGNNICTKPSNDEISNK